MCYGTFHPLHLVNDDLLEFAAGGIDDRAERHSRKLGKDPLTYLSKQRKCCLVTDAQSRCVKKALQSKARKGCDYKYKVITPFSVSGYHSRNDLCCTNKGDDAGYNAENGQHDGQKQPAVFRLGDLPDPCHGI